MSQRAKIKWISEGDVNSKYFHSWINKKLKTSVLEGIWVNNNWVDSVERVRHEVSGHFRKQFTAREIHHPQLPRDMFQKQLSEYHNNLLVSRFTVEEAKAAIWGCDSDKSPGPDGYTFAFFKANWDILQGEVMKMLDEFFENRKIVKGMNSSFVVLIPKKVRSCNIEDFRPISLIGSLYKIIAKILANHISKALDEVVSENQSAFVGGRQILDGIVVLNELIDEAKKKKIKRIIFKVDFAKAYDTVDWDFFRGNDGGP